MKVYLNPFVSVEVADFAAASSAVTKYIDENGLGGRDFYDDDGSLSLEALMLGVTHPYHGGEVLDGSGTVIAVVSYNGRVWKPRWNSYSERWMSGDNELSLGGHTTLHEFQRNGDADK